MAPTKFNLNAVGKYVSENIDCFHNKRLELLQALTLFDLVRAKNPYLFRAKNILLAQDFVQEVLAAHLSASEERAFGSFLEDLAIFISGMTKGAWKSGAAGIDLEFIEMGKHYLVSVKSGAKWGNSSQQADQEANFKRAMRVIKQSSHKVTVEPVLGICYGKTRTSFVRGALKVVGQNFWYLISGSETLYKDIIEPVGYEAKKHNDTFLEGRAAIVNKFTEQFVEEFCIKGKINWPKVVEFNSGNLRRES
jgi:type II restriction endonuclease EcoO109I-like protein